MTGSIKSYKHLFAIVTDKNLIVLDLKSGSIQSILISKSIGASENISRKPNKKVTTQPTGSSHVNISYDGSLIAVASEQKELVVWSLENWQVVLCEKLVKRPMALEFSKDSKMILIADKAGDVYSFSLANKSNTSEKSVPYCDENGYSPDIEPGPVPILGHFSMLLDMTLSLDGKYIITCDRDERIRISHYPNSYNILCFCLGHEEFVTTVCLVPNRMEFLLSASGDGTIRLWNYCQASCLQIVDSKSDVEHFIKENSSKCTEEVKCDKENRKAITKVAVLPLNDDEILVAAICSKLPVIIFYKLKEKKFELIGGYQLPAVPMDIIILEESSEIVIFNEFNSDNLENPFIVLKMNQHSEVDLPIERVTSHPILKLGDDFKDQINKERFHSLEIDSLYKQRYDNMTDYLERKKLRLQSDVPVKKGRYH